MKVSAGEKYANYAILVLFALIAVGPLLSIVTTALTAPSGGFSTANFAEAWAAADFGRYLQTSALVAVLVVGLALVASLLAGYAFGTMRFRGSGVLFYLFLLGLMIPAEAIVIPLFFDLRSLGLTDTLFAIVMPQTAQSIAFGTFWLRTQFRAMPTSLIEAAALDGAGPLGTLFRVLAPAMRGGILTLVVLLFMWTWNEFLIPLVMSPSGRIQTAPLSLAIFQGQYVAETSLLAAAAVFIAAPVVAVYLVAQRYFIRGMLEGADR